MRCDYFLFRGGARGLERLQRRLGFGHIRLIAVDYRRVLLIGCQLLVVVGPLGIQLPPGLGQFRHGARVLEQGVVCGHAFLIGRLPAVQRLLGPLQLLLGVVELGLVFCHGVLIFLQAVFVFLLAVLIFLQAVFIFLLAVVILLPAVVQLGPGVADLVVAQRVGPQRLQRLHALGIVGFAVVELLQGVIQLLLAVGQFFVGFSLAVLILLEAVVIFGPAVGQLLLGVGNHRGPAQLASGIDRVLQDILPGLNGVGILVAEGRALGGDLDIDLRVIVGVVTRLRQEQKGRHCAVAQCRGAPLAAEILGTAAETHQGIGLLGERRFIVGIVPHGNHRAQVILGEVPVVAQALIGGLGHPTRGQHRLVQRGQQRLGGKDHLPVPEHGQQVRAH